MYQQNDQVANPNVRVCRICQTQYIGRGALCPVHAAELAAKQVAQNAVTMIALNTREARQRAERCARQRTEWRECV